MDPAGGTGGRTTVAAAHPRAAGAARSAGGERGSAVVDFVLVGALSPFFLGIVQLALVLHVRNTLIDAAASGARYGTLADRTTADARERTTQLIGVALTRSLPGMSAPRRPAMPASARSR